MKLNRSKPFGTVNPPEIMAGTDRPAVYAQDGKWFDAHDRDIVLGQKLRPEETAGINTEVAQAETERPYGSCRTHCRRQHPPLRRVPARGKTYSGGYLSGG